MSATRIPASDVPPGSVTGSGDYAVGHNGEYFAVSRRCRHLRADLAGGSVDEDGCLVCPWHQSKYDVTTGQMTQGPQGVFAKFARPGCRFHRSDQGLATAPWPRHRRRGRPPDRLTFEQRGQYTTRCRRRSRRCITGVDRMPCTTTETKDRQGDGRPHPSLLAEGVLAPGVGEVVEAAHAAHAEERRGEHLGATQAPGQGLVPATHAKSEPARQRAHDEGRGRGRSRHCVGRHARADRWSGPYPARAGSSASGGVRGAAPPRASCRGRRCCVHPPGW